MSTFSPQYAGIGRSVLEERLAAAEAEIEKLRIENTTLAVGSLFIRWQCPNCAHINTFSGLCSSCGHDPPTEPRGLAANIEATFRLHRVLVRVVGVCFASGFGPTLKIPDGTGGARSIAMRERACLEHENALIDQALTWRQILSLNVADALSRVRPDELSSALVRLAVVVVKWIESLDQE